MEMYVRDAMTFGLPTDDLQVDLRGVDFTSFRVPPCRSCTAEELSRTGIIKPNVVFFASYLHLLLQRHARLIRYSGRDITTFRPR